MTPPGNQNLHSIEGKGKHCVENSKCISQVFSEVVQPRKFVHDCIDGQNQ